MPEYSGGSLGFVRERDLRQRRFIPQLTVATEAANVRAVSIVLTTFQEDANDYVTASEAITLHCELLNSTGEPVAAGKLRQLVIAGGAAGVHTATGVAVLDRLVSVLYFIGGGTDVTDVSDLTSQFTNPIAGQVTNAGGTNTTGGKLVITYVDRAEFHLGEVGAGAEVTGTDRASLIITSSAAGLATVEVTDVVGSSSASLYLKVTPLNVPGFPAYILVAFDGS